MVAKSRDVHSKGFTVATSGSTGQPKACEHAWSCLIEEVDEFIHIFKNEYDLSPTRVVALIPSHNLYGMLFTVLLPHQLDASVVRGFKEYSQVRNGRLHPGDVVVGFPEFLTQIAAEMPALPAGVIFISSAGSCSANTVHQLYALGAARVVDIYGSSETAGVGYRSEPESHYRLLPRWHRDDQNTQRLIDRQHLTAHELPDNIVWETANTFVITGRIDKAVSTRGTNVFPNRIADLIQQHPDVSDASVRPLTLHEGNGLKAFIVLQHTVASAETKQHIRDWLTHHLSPIEIPKHISFGEQLPVNSMCKPRDWPISQS